MIDTCRAFLSRTWVKPLFVTLGLGALLYYFSTQEQFRAMHPRWGLLGLAVLVYQISFFLMTFRICFLLKGAGHHVPWRASWRIYAQSIFYYFFLPLGVGSDIARFMKLQAQCAHIPKSHLASNILLDRGLGLGAALCWTLLLFPFVNPNLPISLPTILIGIAFAFVIFVGLYKVFQHHPLVMKLRALLPHDAKGVICLVSAASVALLVHFLMACSTFLAAQAVDLNVQFTSIIFGCSAAMIFMVLPISFGGVSPVEAAAVGIFLALGYDTGTASMLAFWGYAFRLFAALQGGVWELFSKKR